MDGFNLIQDSGVNNALARRLNTISGPASSLAPEVMPITWASRWDNAQDWLAGTRRCMSGPISAASAGNFSGIRLRNPVGSRMLIVLEWCIAVSPLDVRIGITPATTDLSAGATGSGTIDSRKPVNNATTQTQAVVSVGVAGSPTFTTSGRQTGFLPANNGNEVHLGFVLAPGSAFEVWSNAVNTQIYATMQWTERAVQPSELG